MKFKEKASSLALCAVLLGTSIAPVSAATKTEIVGANRYETAAKIADKMGNYDTAILVNTDKSLADGLSASSLAGKENAPILLVKKDSIPVATMQRLRNVKRVYVIGGTAAIGSGVTNKLSGKDVTRIEGKNRIETSENVAKVVGNYDEAFIVNGNKGEADAMSVASVAARDKAPIILTNGTSSNQSKKSGVKYYVVGGSAVVSNSLVNKFGAIRLSGSNRYATNRAVVSKFYANSGKLYYTKGDLWVDALTVSSLAKNNGVVLVSAKSDNSILKGKDIVNVGKVETETNKPNKPITVEYFKPLILDQSTKNKMKGLSMPDNAIGIKYDDLRRVNVKYWGFDNKTHTDGVLIVNKSVANDICSIFNDLYKAKYPIEKIRMIDEYKANDESSMIDNNTSAFCYRLVAGTKVLSKHGKGVAIDINPLYNPQVKNGKVYPSISKPYADRSKNVKGMIKKGDACYKAFTSRGWKWGGNWKNSKDYQHFEKIQ